MEPVSFGAFVARRRKALGLTQAQLAGKLQITDKAVSKWERGLGLPDISLLESLADALGLSIVELMKTEILEEKTIPLEEASCVMSEALVQTEKRWSKKTRLLAAALAAILLLIAATGAGLWVWRHPRITVGYAGELIHPPRIVSGTVPEEIRSPIIYIADRDKDRVPKDILLGIRLWASELGALYFQTQNLYDRLVLSYETWYENGETVLTVTGSGRSRQTGKETPIDLRIVYDFKLYGVPER